MKAGARNKMKKKCKNINLRDPECLIPAVKDVVFRHYRRYDFRNVLFHFGLSEDDYNEYFLTKNKALFDDCIRNIATECARRIINRDLKLKPVIIREKLDKTTGKVRLIGKESAMQQVFDYIVLHGSDEIFRRRFVSEQASSIKGRGQVYGKEMIKGWIDADNDALRYAARHDVLYTRKCKYHVKIDIQKCYPSAKLEIFMSLFSKECANQDLIWLYETLLRSHRVGGYTGFMIGSVISQNACQYMLSFLYRYAKDLHYERRGKKYMSVSHMLLFLDDMLLMGSNRKELKSAVRSVARYAEKNLGFKIKPNWQIHDIDKDPIDMMGYVVFSDGHVEIRGRDFVKARRMLLRYYSQGNYLTLKQCQRICSYKGFFDHSDSKHAREIYHLKEVIEYASEKISRREKQCLIKK